jgi:plasmid stabilization system protein ParE
VPRRLSYTGKALGDLDAAWRWLTQPGSGVVAWTKFDAIVTAIESLRDHPCRWPLGRHPGVRELPCAGGYRALYVVNLDTGSNETAGDVLVLRVFGPGQNRRRI